MEILGAARRCFSEAGYHETRVDEIARRAGLSKGAIYWYFNGKRELFLALFERYLEELAAQRYVAAGSATVKNPREGIGGAAGSGWSMLPAMSRHR